MRRKITEEPNETPILFVLTVLGLLSYLAAFPVTDLRGKSLLVFDITKVAVFICGLCALPLGLKMSNIRLNEAWTPHIVMAKMTSWKTRKRRKAVDETLEKIERLKELGK